MKRVMRPMESLPGWASLNDTIRDRYIIAGRALAAITSIDFDAWRETADAVSDRRDRYHPTFEAARQELEDEVLPLYLQHRGEPKTFASRTNAEREALARHYPALADAVRGADYEAFEITLCQLAAQMNPDSGKLRSGPIYISADRQGNYWEFSGAEHVRPTLRRTFELIRGEGHGIHAGALCYLMLVHAHPFMDGNGRTARLLCNFVWQYRACATVYVPLKELFFLGRGSFGIAMTRLREYGEWNEFHRFFCVGLELLTKFPASPLLTIAVA